MIRILCMTGWLCFLVSCHRTGSIAVPETLTLALGDSAASYVVVLREAEAGDDEALAQFLSKRGIENGPGYDHGCVVLDLLRETGDARFFGVARQLDTAAQMNLADYIRVGVDMLDLPADSLGLIYPQTWELLGGHTW